MNEKISVIIPVYNCEKYLEKTIKSIIIQTYSNLEIILIDDGSSDDSIKIMQKFQKKDKRIEIFSTEHQGVSNARNIGIQNSTSPLITFVDGDDYLEKNAYQKALENIKNLDEIDLICFGIRVFGNNQIGNFKKDEEYYNIKFSGFKKLDKDIFLSLNTSLCNKIFKKEIIFKNEIDFPKNLHYEDCAFCIKYLSCIKNIFFIKEKFYNYRRRENSIMAKTFAQSDFALDHLYILIDIHNHLKKVEKLEKYFDLFVEFFVSFFFFSFAYSPKDKKKEVLESAYFLACKFFKNKNTKNKLIFNLMERDFDKIFEKKLKFYQKIFSIVNDYSVVKNKKEKIVYLFGKKFEIDIKKEIGV